MNTSPLLIVEGCLDKRFCLFHVRLDLGNADGATFRRANYRTEKAFKMLTSEGRNMLSEILTGARGVENVRVHQYSFTVCLATAFSWEEVVPHVVSALLSIVVPSSSTHMISDDDVEYRQYKPVRSFVGCGATVTKMTLERIAQKAARAT